MIVEVRSRQFDDSIADKHWIPPDQLTIMEENSLDDMEGYLEVKSAKMLTPNKKYWFVLSHSCLDYYENKASKAKGKGIVGSVAIVNLLEVQLDYSARSSLILIRKGEAPVHLKVKSGNAGSWVGALRERMFLAREEGERKSKSSVREESLLKRRAMMLAGEQKVEGLAGGKRSASTSNISNLSPISARTSRKTSLHIPQSPRTPSPNKSTGISFAGGRRSKDSSPCSSISSNTSATNKVARIPINKNTVTSRLVLDNEKDMVESAGLTTSEDREWVVQAQRWSEPEVEEEQKLREDEEGGGGDSPLILRHPRRHSRGHVTFNQHDDIRPISTLLERSRSAKKEKKEREKEERELSDVKEEVVGEMRERKNSAFSWITNSMRRKKKKPKGSEAEVEGDCKMVSRCESTPHLNQAVIKEEDEMDLNENTERREGRRNTLATPQEVGVRLRSEPQQQSEADKTKTEPAVKLRPRSTTDSIRRSAVTRSASLRLSSDSLSGVSNDIREKILAWKSSPPRTPKKVIIEERASLPLVEPVAVVEAAIDDLIEDRVALERLEEVYMAKSLTSQELSAALAPALPPKPTAFHILQLERLLDGRICPTTDGEKDDEAAHLLLDSLKVMASMEGVVAPKPEPIYDVPRPLEVELGSGAEEQDGHQTPRSSWNPRSSWAS